MSWLYSMVIVGAAFVVADDMGLGNIHPVKGAFIMFALAYNLAYTIYKNERKVKR